MREILFRGKTIKDNKWVYGYYTSDKNGHYILVNYDNDIKQHTVYENSVGQWTGRYDKNGTKMFEGDIVAKPFSIVLLTVKYNEQNSQYMLYKPKSTAYCMPTMIPNNNEITIAGNQFDKTQREKNTISNNLDINIKKIEQIEQVLNISFTEQQMQFLLFGKSHKDMKYWDRCTGKTFCSFIKSIMEIPKNRYIYYDSRKDKFYCYHNDYIYNDKSSDLCEYNFCKYDKDVDLYNTYSMIRKNMNKTFFNWLTQLKKHNIIQFYYDQESINKIGE